MRFVAVLAFTAWGLSQLFSGSAATARLDDLAILLFVVDAGSAVVGEALSLLRRHNTATEAPRDLLVPRPGCRCEGVCSCAKARSVG